jgi:RsmE family RNA methyltransferase
MNRILFDACERAGELLVLRDGRAEHIRRVLKAEAGETLRLGQIDGPLAEGVLLPDSPGQEVWLRLQDGPIPPIPPVDLLLALPRPKVLHRLLPQIAAMGVGRLFLCTAARVERFYFDTHVLDPQALRASLLEGLTQCGDTRLPELRIVRRLQPFLQDEVTDLSGGMDRWLLHPGATDPLSVAQPQCPRRMLAIGPEGGWVPHELELFAACGFQSLSLGPRILRSDTATLAALALAHSRTP